MIESIQTSATAGPMTGSAASKKHPIFEQLSLANIFHFGPPLDERERSFEPVSAAPTIWRPEVGATRPTRSADGAVGVLVDTAPILSMELCLPGSGSGVASRDAMSALQEAGGNARWLSSQCPRCIADGSARRTSDPLAARRPGGSVTLRDEFV